LPKEYEKCLVGLIQSQEKRGQLSLAKESYSLKLDLLTNAMVVDDAIRFVSQQSKEKLRSSANESEYEKEESNEPDYHEDEHQLEEEQEEEETGEITSTTIN
jgi:hypothetical protein